MKKRTIKLTEKALLEKIDHLQRERSGKFKKAVGLKETIVGLMSDKSYVNEVKGKFSKYKVLCDEAKENHDILLGLLPKSEAEKHEMWYKVKMQSVNEFVSKVNNWLDLNEKSVHDDVGPDEINLNGEPPGGDNVEPQNSVSNVEPTTSNKSNVSKTSRSSASSSARLQAEAERAALLAHAAARQKKHALEDQADQLRRRKEQLELETELAVSAAKLAVWAGSCHGSVSGGSAARTDGMESYFKKGMESKHHVKEHSAPQINVSQQTHSLPVNIQTNSTRPKDENDITAQQTGSHQVGSHPSGQQATQAQVPGDFYSLLQRQTETTALLARMQCSQSLPHRDIPVFDGNPLQYRSFIRAFEQCIESKTLNHGDRLYYLEQFTRGQPKDLVRSCQHMSPDKGYIVAKDLLKTHFGHELKITAAYVDRIIGWPALKAEDVKGLQAYALYLRECCNAMEELHYLDELNMPANMKSIIQRLPYKLREKWRVTQSLVTSKMHKLV